jgi:hypothetical protein
VALNVAFLKYKAGAKLAFFIDISALRDIISEIGNLTHDKPNG